MARKTYSDKQKDRIIRFALSQGRGGLSATTKKFGVAFTTLQKWIGGPQPATVNKRKSGAKIDGRKLRRVRTANTLMKAIEKQVKILSKTLRGLK